MCRFWCSFAHSSLNGGFDHTNSAVDANPKWGVPPKYSFKAAIINLITLQNMGLMQCSLLGMFENSAITTKVMVRIDCFIISILVLVYL